MAQALEGIKVIEAAAALAGPMGGRLLADWGADVIHIEHPERGDVSRTLKGKAQSKGRTIESDINYAAQNLNRDKRGLTLDLSKEDGREIIHRLLEKADVFLSNFRYRELEKFELEYKRLSRVNPRLIYASLTGYGRKGPDKDQPAYDHTSYFSRSGIFHLQPSPKLHPFGFGDHVTGLALAYGVMTALFVRERTGIGQEVDASLFQTGVFAISYDIAGALVTGQDRRPIEREEATNALTVPYLTKDDRWLRLGMPQPDHYWSRFCRALEREDLEHDPRFESFDPRIENHLALFKIVEEAFLSKTLAEWRIRLTEAGIPWAPIQILPEVVNDPQARDNDFFVPLNHPTYSRIEVVANPVKLSKTPATVRMPAPEFGQHTEEILLEHGYTWEDIGRFKQSGVIL